MPPFFGALVGVVGSSLACHPPPVLVSTGRRVGRSARSVVVGPGFESDSCDSDCDAGAVEEEDGGSRAVPADRAPFLYSSKDLPSALEGDLAAPGGIAPPCPEPSPLLVLGVATIGTAIVSASGAVAPLGVAGGGTRVGSPAAGASVGRGLATPTASPASSSIGSRETNSF